MVDVVAVEDLAVQLVDSAAVVGAIVAAAAAIAVDDVEHVVVAVVVDGAVEDDDAEPNPVADGGVAVLPTAAAFE